MKISDLRKGFKTISEFENIISKQGKSEKKTFQRLEFLGDKVLGLILSSIIFDKHGSFNEGMLSRSVSHLCSGKVLFEIAKELELSKYYKNKQKEISVKGIIDCLEAIIGAYYTKNGFFKTKELVSSLWKNNINDIKKIKADNKTSLQEWSQSKKLGLPEYNLVKRKGPDHAPVFTVRVKVSDHEAKNGKGRTLQDAEQNAAKEFLTSLKM